MLPESDAPFVEDEAAWPESEDWFAEAEAAGWLAELELEAGWFVPMLEADCDCCDWADCDVYGWALLSAANAGKVAATAAARASFLKSMVVFLSSYTERKDTVNDRAVHFGTFEARKFPCTAAPRDARSWRRFHGGTAT